MKLSAQSEKTWIVVLGVVSAILIVNLVSEMRRTHASTTAMGATARPGRLVRRVVSAPAALEKDDLSRYDPTVNLAALKKISSRPAPEPGRNPFEFPPPKIVPGKMGGSAAGPQKPAPPPPPPPLPIKALGFADRGKGVRQVVLTDDQGLYVVAEGDVFNKKYRVIKISPNSVEVEDDTTHQTSELPLPQ